MEEVDAEGDARVNAVVDAVVDAEVDAKVDSKIHWHITSLNARLQEAYDQAQERDGELFKAHDLIEKLKSELHKARDTIAERNSTIAELCTKKRGLLNQRKQKDREDHQDLDEDHQDLDEDLEDRDEDLEDRDKNLKDREDRDGDEDHPKSNPKGHSKGLPKLDKSASYDDKKGKEYQGKGYQGKGSTGKGYHPKGGGKPMTKSEMTLIWWNENYPPRRRSWSENEELIKAGEKVLDDRWYTFTPQMDPRDWSFLALLHAVRNAMNTAGAFTSDVKAVNFVVDTFYKLLWNFEKVGPAYIQNAEVDVMSYFLTKHRDSSGFKNVRDLGDETYNRRSDSGSRSSWS
jgi:hypothetical protein